jgi:RNA-directed DNA polymerase
MDNLVLAIRPLLGFLSQGGYSPVLQHRFVQLTLDRGVDLRLDELDKELERWGHRFCRYADDCNVYVCSRQAGERVMASVSGFLKSRLWLEVNKSKSAMARPEERKFLGFSITNDRRQRQMRRTLSNDSSCGYEIGRCGVSLATLASRTPRSISYWLARLLWLLPNSNVLSTLDTWIRRRLRMYLWWARSGWACAKKRSLRGIKA